MQGGAEGVSSSPAFYATFSSRPVRVLLGAPCGGLTFHPGSSIPAIMVFQSK